MAAEDDLEPMDSLNAERGGEEDEGASAAPRVQSPKLKGEAVSWVVEDEIPPEPPEPPPGRVMQPRTGDFPESLLTYYEGELPGDILAVWGVSRSSELSARIMIAGWGIERFRDSEVHQMAVKEQTSDARMDPIRKAFVAAQKKKEEKGK